MIDTHCHIDLYEFPLQIARLAEAQAVRTIAVTHLPSHYLDAVRNLNGFKFIVPSLGMHPLVAHKHESELPLFKALCSKASYIGEVGLDFSRQGRGSASIQRRSFEFILDCFSGHSKFVTLHSRGAENEVIDCLRSFSVEDAVFHYFSGTRSQLAKVLDSGHYVSINTAMIAMKKWADLIRFVPRNRVLAETDGPFVLSGNRPVVPSDVAGVYRWLASKWEASLETVIEQLRQNFASIETGIG